MFATNRKINLKKKMKKIDQLPVEVLIEIFRYLPRYDDVSLVSKLFYDVACLVRDSKNCVSFNLRSMVRDFFLFAFVIR